MSKKTHVILNPAAAGGKTGRNEAVILSVLKRSLGEGFSLCRTREPGEATRSAREAALAGATLVVAVGGDGTAQEVVNGLFAGGAPLHPACSLGLISAGTGNGFAQSLGLPADLESQAAGLRRGQTRRVDLGRVVSANGDGSPRERYFINECQAGIGGEVVQRVREGRKRWGGFLAFGLTTLGAILDYPNRRVAISVDGRRTLSGPFIGIVAANGSVMAGGMRLAPRADVYDGLLDILLIHGQTLGERLRHFPKIYSGRHLDSPKFSYFRATSLSLSSSDGVAFEADGEFLGRLPCRVEVLPSALRLRAAFPATG